MIKAVQDYFFKLAYVDYTVRDLQKQRNASFNTLKDEDEFIKKA